MHEPTNEEKLESLIDNLGARVVIEHFSDIAYAKAEHLRHNWQDERSARNWDHFGNKLAALARWTREVVG